MSFEDAITPLLDCMCTALAEQGWEGDCCLIPGEAAFDSCCEGNGEAWGRLVRAYPSSQFPQEDGRGALTECTPTMQWALVIELGAIRCICMDACDCAKKAANATKVLGDAEAALQGVLCCFNNGLCRGVEYQIQSLQPTNGFGGCGGFKIQLVRQYLMTCCLSDESA